MMTRRFLVALGAALFSFCSLQAASLAWTSDGLPDYRQWGGAGCKVTDAQSFTLVLTWQQSADTAAWDNILGVGKRGLAHGDMVRVQTSGDNTVSIYGNLGVEGVQNTNKQYIEIDPDKPLRIIVTRTGQEVSVYIGNFASLTFTANEAFASMSNPDDLIFGFGASGNNGSDGAGDKAAGTYTDIGIYNGVLTAEEIALIADPAMPLEAVPEPAASALLALGLSALALRRRAA